MFVQEDRCCLPVRGFANLGCNPLEARLACCLVAFVPADDFVLAVVEWPNQRQVAEMAALADCSDELAKVSGLERALCVW